MVEDVQELLALPDGARLEVLSELEGKDRRVLFAELERLVREEGEGGVRMEALEALEAAALEGMWAGYGGLLCDVFEGVSGEFGALVAEKIGGWDLAQMTPSLIKRLQESEEAPMRFWCIYALGNLGAMEAVEVLKAVRDDQREVEGWWSVGEEADYMLRQLLGDWPHPTPRADATLGA